MVQFTQDSMQKSADSTATAAPLDGVAICPLPKASKHVLPYPFTRLMDYALIQRGLSWLTWLFSSPAFYDATCDQEIQQFTQQMWSIYKDETKTTEEKALLLSAIAAYGLASRPTTSYAAQNDQPAQSIPLPIYCNGQPFIEPCVLLKELFLLDIPVRVFVPLSGRGSPLYLFTPTGAWANAPGMTMQILDDLNPIAPGTTLQRLAKEQLPPFLSELVNTYQEKAYFVGHSLGGILSTSIAVELPHLVQHVCAFNPSRPFPALINQWRLLQSSSASKHLPNIHTYVSEWENGKDPLTYLGGNWIGTVHRIQHQAPNNPFDRHASFLLPKSSESLCLESNCSDSRPPHHALIWVALHRTLVTFLLIISIILIGIKRLLVGWKQGYLLRFGLLGLPYTLYLACKAALQYVPNDSK